MIRRSVAVAALAFLAAACSPDEPQFLAAPQGAGVAGRPSETIVPTTEGGTDPTTVDAHRVPALTGAPPPSANGNLGSGCTPVAGGGQPIDDGLWAGFVKQRQPLVVTDLICLTSSSQQINNSPTERQNPPDPTLQVFDTAGAVDAEAWLTSAPDDTLYWIAVNNGQVTSVEAISN